MGVAKQLSTLRIRLCFAARSPKNFRSMISNPGLVGVST